MTEKADPWMRVGDLRVAAVSDGIAQFAPSLFFSQADWSGEHAHFVDSDGLIRVPVGCFVVRTGELTVLIDAGVGPASDASFGDTFRCGNLPAALRDIGVMPEDIDIVVPTHLHVDHAGWVSSDGRPTFPNATIRFGAADWDGLIAVDHQMSGSHVCAGMRLLAEHDRLSPITRDGEAIAPGITARASPGHTPGHQTLILSSGEERLVILGDAVTCPLQLTHPDWAVLSDIDPELGNRTRIALLREIEGDRVVGPHFPGLKAGRLLRGTGTSYHLG